MEGLWKFLEGMFENNPEFPGGRCKTKNLLLGENGYFLELHIMNSREVKMVKTSKFDFH